jgi:hypothetical protein
LNKPVALRCPACTRPMSLRLTNVLGQGGLCQRCFRREDAARAHMDARTARSLAARAARYTR